MLGLKLTHLLRYNMPPAVDYGRHFSDRLLRAKYARIRSGKINKKKVQELYDHGRLASLDDLDSALMSPGRQALYPPHLKMEELVEGLKRGTFSYGRFKLSPGNHLEGVVALGEREWFVRGKLNMNRAMEGDCVVAELLPLEQWCWPERVMRMRADQEDDQEEAEQEADPEMDGRIVDAAAINAEAGPSAPRQRREVETKALPSARIVGILERNSRDYCGMLLLSDRARGTRRIFTPVEKTVPRILVDTRHQRELMGKKIIVRFDDWPCHSRYPFGHYVRPISAEGEQKTEEQVILLENGIDYGNFFSDGVMRCLPDSSWRPTLEANREDFTHLNIFSIDPEGCTDIDDSLHCTQLGEDDYEVGVHIADVSHFVRAGTELDKEARHRGTTVYLCASRYEMLPQLLSTNLCSLREGELRYAFSVIWRMKGSGEVISTRFTKSLIRSRAALTYMRAQEMLDDASIQNDPIADSLRQLMRLAREMKKRRKHQGALELASSEIVFEMDALSGKPMGVFDKSYLESMSLVEEFMLLANVSAARKVLDAYPDCAILRRHPTPPKKFFDPLIELANACGFPLDVSSGKKLSDSLDAIEAICKEQSTDEADKTLVSRMFRMLTTRCMTLALYFPAFTQATDRFFHYGLQTTIYTHFTSPIRRYADIMVHRLLANALQLDELHPAMLDKKLLRQIVDNLNTRHINAKRAARDSALLNTVLLLREQPEANIGAIVIDISKNGFKVMVPKYALESAIIIPDDVVKAATHQEMANYLSTQGIRLLDNVRVSLSATLRNHTRKIDIGLVEPRLEKYVPLTVGCALDLPKK